MKEILNPDYIQCYIDVKNNEKDFAMDRTKKHLDDRLKWIIRKERLSKAVTGYRRWYRYVKQKCSTNL